MKIVIETIPHASQRYPTCGDYWVDVSGLQVRVSEEMGDDSCFLVALHELIELHLLAKRGVSIAAIDAFDTAYEKAHRVGGTLDGPRIEGDNAEPGDDPAAPYYEEHQFATAIEQIVCARLGMPWAQHAANVDKLP